MLTPCSRQKTYGATTVDFSQYSDVAKRIREIIPEGIDAGIDAAGFRFAKSVAHKVMRATGMETDSPEVLNEIIRSVKKFGRISVIADYAAFTNGFLIGGVMEKGITLVGAGQCPAQKYMAEIMDLIASGKFDPTTILTHRFALEDLPEVYAAFDEKRDGMMKVFIQVRPLVLFFDSTLLILVFADSILRSRRGWNSFSLCRPQEAVNLASIPCFVLA